LEQIGTKPIETFTIKVDHDPDQWLCISDKNRKDLDKLEKGSVWRVDGKDYKFDEQVNYYVLRRVDYEAV
jgi:hypothetical protein